MRHIVLARLAQGGAVYWALGVFSPNRVEDRLKMRAEAASAIGFTVKRIKGYARRCVERLRLSEALKDLTGYARSLRQ